MTKHLLTDADSSNNTKKNPASKAKFAKKKLLFARRFYTHYKQKFQVWSHFFSLLLPKDSENLKILDIGLCKVGAKSPLNGVRNTDTKKILLIKAKFPPKKNLFCTARAEALKIWE